VEIVVLTLPAGILSGSYQGSMYCYELEVMACEKAQLRERRTYCKYSEGGTSGLPIFLWGGQSPAHILVQTWIRYYYLSKINRTKVHPGLETIGPSCGEVSSER
jgi:hypothetical protein